MHGRPRRLCVPLPPSLCDEVQQFRTCLGAIAGWVFARESDGEAPTDRHLFDKWLAVAEARAELPKLDGGLWHPYRRKWATERKHLPLKDVAAAGGWRDVETLLECYQQPDAETLLAVMAGGRRLHDPPLAPQKGQRQRQRYDCLAQMSLRTLDRTGALRARVRVSGCGVVCCTISWGWAPPEASPVPARIPPEKTALARVERQTLRQSTTARPS